MIINNFRRLVAILSAVLVAALALAGCSVDRSGEDKSKPTIRLAYQSFPSGDLIVKNNKWLEEALPDFNIKWTKFDSGADINTAFVAKEVDFAAIGSSPVARGLSAPNFRADRSRPAIACRADRGGHPLAAASQHGSVPAIGKNPRLSAKYCIQNAK